MRRLVRSRLLSLFLLLLCSILYLLRPRTSLPPEPPPPHSHLPPKIPFRPIRAKPIYEYTSLYRQRANKQFEGFLDAKLRTLHHAAQKTLGKDGLTAELKIHQFTTPELAKTYIEWSDQWKTNNKGWGYKLTTETPKELLAIFSEIPQIGEVYEKHAELRSDLWRHLTLWYFGGLYADIETWERVSLSACDPFVEVREGRKNISLMLGVGKDEPFMDPGIMKYKYKDWSRATSFTNKMMWAPKRFDPMLRKAIVRSISHARIWEEVGGNIDEVSGTGMLTDVVMEMLSENLEEGHWLRDRDAGLERRVTWKGLKGIDVAQWIEVDDLKGKVEGMGGLAVLPINTWMNGLKHSNSGTEEAEGACVNWMPGILTGGRRQ